MAIKWPHNQYTVEFLKELFTKQRDVFEFLVLYFFDTLETSKTIMLEIIWEYGFKLYFNVS